MPAEKEFPVEEWLLERPLYSPIELGEVVHDAVKTILKYSKTFDVYCPECRQSATFRPIVSSETKEKNSEAERLDKLRMFGGNTSPLSVWNLPSFSKTIICTRNQHHIDFHFVMKGQSLINAHNGDW